MLGACSCSPPLGAVGWAGCPCAAACSPVLPQGGQVQSWVCRATSHSPCGCECSSLLPLCTLSAGSRKLEYNGQTWHEHCFICSSCQQPIGSRSFIPDKKDYYCVPCYESKFAPRCTRCKKVCVTQQPIVLDLGVCSLLVSEPHQRRVQAPAPPCVTSVCSLPADPDQGRSDLPG